MAVALGKTVNNGWGGAECCWARTMLAVVVGALEVPGGTIGGRLWAELVTVGGFTPTAAARTVTISARWYF